MLSGSSEPFRYVTALSTSSTSAPVAVAPVEVKLTVRVPLATCQVANVWPPVCRLEPEIVNSPESGVSAKTSSVLVPPLRAMTSREPA